MTSIAETGHTEVLLNTIKRFHSNTEGLVMLAM